MTLKSVRSCSRAHGTRICMCTYWYASTMTRITSSHALQVFHRHAGFDLFTPEYSTSAHPNDCTREQYSSYGPSLCHLAWGAVRLATTIRSALHGCSITPGKRVQCTDASVTRSKPKTVPYCLAGRWGSAQNSLCHPHRIKADGGPGEALRTGKCCCCLFRVLTFSENCSRHHLHF